ncbi:MAG: hypothetical protein IH614_11670 [Desulfuromonadales bacterium]|nr:hypothetical protein [Desulfuromonadales bacterium]
MRVSEWLDQQEADHVDVSGIDLPADLLYDDQPDETLYFEEINPCGIFCKKNHPFSTVERFGHWYYGRGQDREAGLHSSDMKWKLLTRDKSLALTTAKAHIE